MKKTNKNNWEKEFEQEFADKIVAYKHTMNCCKCYYFARLPEIKQFISNLLEEERQRIIERMKEMRLDINDDYSEGYNDALQDMFYFISSRNDLSKLLNRYEKRERRERRNYMDLMK